MSRGTRWCPTPEQLIILEELYRGGLRTPKAPIIQKIASHLSLYGKIEGKNVFCWFQNHKARDRQKLRKKLSNQLLLEEQQFFKEHQVQMNYIQASPCFYPHHSHPHQPVYNHQPQHGSATCVPQSMVEDASLQRYYVWKMDDDLPKRCEAENGLTRTCRNDCLMMVDPSIQSCNNNRPLETLDLFPTRATNFN